jgi:acetyl-CoA acyltransferase 1
MYSAHASVTRSSLQVIELQKAQDCLLPMGITSENVAERYGVTRQEQDQAAVSSLEHRLCFISIALTQIKNVFKTLPF